jgi:hypothetical protein
MNISFADAAATNGRLGTSSERVKISLKKKQQYEH